MVLVAGLRVVGVDALHGQVPLELMLLGAC